MIESLVVMRQEGDETIGWGPKQSDQDKYGGAIEDWSARGYNLLGQAQHDALNAEPRVMLVQWRISNSQWAAFSTDNAIWPLASRQWADWQKSELLDNNFEDVYSAAERTDRIDGLVNFFGLNRTAVESRWLETDTRMEVAKKMAKFLGNRE